MKLFLAACLAVFELGCGNVTGLRTDGAAGAPATGGKAGAAGEPGTRGAAGSGGADGGGAGGTNTGRGGSDASGGRSADGGAEAPVSDGGCANTACGTSCLDLQANVTNCGACGYACVNGRTCVSGSCTPAWLPMTLTGQPMERGGTAAAGIGDKLLVTGGPCTTGPSVTTSTVYDSATDTWAATAPMKSPRAQHLMVSSGTQVYTFGGLTDCRDGTTVGPGLEEFDPIAKTWTTITVPNAPPPRYAFGMTWTGSEVFLYGGSGGESSGGRYNVATGTWSDASCALTGCARDNEFLFSAQGFVYLWGGSMGDAPAGKQFDLANGTWSPWTVPAVQLPGDYPDDGERIFVVTSPVSGCSGTTTVTIYDRATGQLLATDAQAAPAGVIGASTIVWTGSEVIAWSGGCGSNPTNGGGRYQPPAP